MSDPAYAARMGVAPMAATPLLDYPRAARLPIGATHADWLRGAAAAMLPAGEPHEIVEGLGGEAVLVLSGRRR